MYDTAWLLPISNVALIMVYLMHSAWRPGLRSRHKHANLREDWFDAVSSQAGTEVLAVQTLRNSVMTATMIASTSALGLMGAISLAAPSLRGMLDTNASLQLLTPRNFLEFTLMALLFTTIVMNAMAVRNYTHAGFVVGMPVDSSSRARWAATGKAHLRSAGVMYSWGLRCLMLVAPVLVAIVQGGAGLVATLLIVGILMRLESATVAMSTPLN